MFANVCFRLLVAVSSQRPNRNLRSATQIRSAITMSHASRAHKSAVWDFLLHTNSMYYMCEHWTVEAFHSMAVATLLVYSHSIWHSAFNVVSFAIATSLLGERWRMKMRCCGCVDEKSLKFEADKQLWPVSHSRSHPQRQAVAFSVMIYFPNI